ncbi:MULTISPECIES: hypothetical protein [Bacillaceae]|nr:MULTISPECIES: hypothetical protein [Bacillaceae]
MRKKWDRIISKRYQWFVEVYRNQSSADCKSINNMIVLSYN